MKNSVTVRVKIIISFPRHRPIILNKSNIFQPYKFISRGVAISIKKTLVFPAKFCNSSHLSGSSDNYFRYSFSTGIKCSNTWVHSTYGLRVLITNLAMFDNLISRFFQGTKVYSLMKL